MTRTPYLQPHEMSAEQRQVYDQIVASRGTWLNGPFAPMLHQPRMAAPAAALGEFLRYHTSLGPPLSELAIIVVARFWGSDFEWYQHAKIALKSSVPAEVVAAIRADRRPPDMDQRQTAVYEFAHALLETHRVPPDVYDRAKTLFGVTGVVELTGLIGYYTFIALTLLAHEVPLPEGVGPQLDAREALD
jgi:4-carboxymuconolactone decarboxylase